MSTLCDMQTLHVEWSYYEMKVGCGDLLYAERWTHTLPAVMHQEKNVSLSVMWTASAMTNILKAS